ncbi:MAG: hypothetical protein HZB16_12705 [Armatimonadetes bacterium]|nr:hypothetical protein [Armatimonadota bacterium]
METETTPTNALPPTEAPGELWLLTADGWAKLGDAAVMQARWTNALELKGALAIPDGLQNRWVWLAHEGHIYRATYLSHVGNNGVTEVSLKIDATLTPQQYAQLPATMATDSCPTADQLRRQRFGGEYHSYRRMFAEHGVRLV